MPATEGAQEVRPALRETAIALMTMEDGTSGEGLANFVGPVLRVGDLADAVVRAIEEDNPGKQVRIIDRGDYVRIHTEKTCRLTRQTLERLLGYDYDLRLLEIDMPSFSGRLRTRADEYVWYYLTGDAEPSAAGGKTS
jgi:nucleoside-diphosphate-sugar epimerase